MKQVFEAWKDEGSDKARNRVESSRVLALKSSLRGPVERRGRNTLRTLCANKRILALCLEKVKFTAAKRFFHWNSTANIMKMLDTSNCRTHDTNTMKTKLRTVLQYTNKLLKKSCWQRWRRSVRTRNDTRKPKTIDSISKIRLHHGIEKLFLFNRKLHRKTLRTHLRTKFLLWQQITRRTVT